MTFLTSASLQDQTPELESSVFLVYLRPAGKNPVVQTVCDLIDGTDECSLQTALSSRSLTRYLICKRNKIAEMALDCAIGLFDVMDQYKQ